MWIEVDGVKRYSYGFYMYGMLHIPYVRSLGANENTTQLIFIGQNKRQDFAIYTGVLKAEVYISK